MLVTAPVTQGPSVRCKKNKGALEGQKRIPSWGTTIVEKRTWDQFIYCIIFELIATPQKSNIDTKNIAMFKGSCLFQTIILGIHVSFRECNMFLHFQVNHHAKMKLLFFHLSSELQLPKKHPTTKLLSTNCKHYLRQSMQFIENLEPRNFRKKTHPGDFLID